MRPVFPLLRGVFTALVPAALAFWTARWLGPENFRTAYGIYLYSVIVSAYFGGMWSGVLATGLAALGLHHQHSALPTRAVGDFVPSLVLLVLLGILAAHLIAECLRAVLTVQRLEDGLGRLPDGVVVTDRRGRVASLNQAARDLSGWSGPEAERQPLSRAFPLIDPSTRLGLSPPATGVRGTALLLARDGSEKSVQFETTPLPNIGGIMLILRRAGSPVTPMVPREDPARRQLEDQLAQLRQQLDTQRHAVQERDTAAAQRLAALDRVAQEASAARQAAEEELRRVREDEPNARRRADQELAAQLHVAWQADEEQRRTAQAAQLAAERQQAEEQLRAQLAEQVRAAQMLREQLTGLQAQLRAAEEQARARKVDESQAKQVDELRQAVTAARAEADQRRQAEESLRRELTTKQTEWQRAEAEWRREAERLTGGAREAQQVAAGRQQAEAQLRQEWEKKQAEWRKIEAELRRELEAKQAEWRGADEGRTRDFAAQQAEWRRLEAELRRELEAKQAEWRRSHEEAYRASETARAARERTEAELRAELEQWVEASGRLEEELAQARWREEELRREAGEREAAWRRTEEELRRLTEEERDARAREHAEQAAVLRREREERRELEGRATAARQGGDLWEAFARRACPVVVGLRGAAQMLRDGLGDDAPLTPSAAALCGELWRLERIVNGFSAAAMLARGTAEAHRRPVELARFLGRVAELAAPVLAARNQHLTVRLPLETQWLWADEVWLAQAVAALLDNAVRHAPPGTELRLTAEQRGDDVTLALVNSVAGAEDGVLELPAGPRLGLGVARRVAEMHAGSFRSGPTADDYEAVLTLPALACCDARDADRGEARRLALPVVMAPERLAS